MRNHIVLLIVLGALCVLVPRQAACIEKNGLDFVVSTDKKVYTVGELIRVSFKWTNVTDRKLVVVNWRGPTGGITDIGQGPEKTYDFVVLYEGKEMLPYHGEFVCGPRGELDLEAKKSLERDYDISDVYSFTRPGRYVIRTTYSGFAYDDEAPEHWLGRITHPDVEVWVQE